MTIYLVKLSSLTEQPKGICMKFSVTVKGRVSTYQKIYKIQDFFFLIYFNVVSKLQVDRYVRTYVCSRY